MGGLRFTGSSLVVELVVIVFGGHEVSCQQKPAVE